MQQLLTGRTCLPPSPCAPMVPKGYKPSELGEIPEDWGIAEIRELLPYNHWEKGCK